MQVDVETLKVPYGRVRAMCARVTAVALCTVLWSCAASRPPAPDQVALTGTSGDVGSASTLGSLRPVEVEQVEDTLEEAPVNHGIALGSLEMASLSSHVDAASVERTIAKQLGSIRDCMERKQERNGPARAGKVKVAMTIMPAGHVRDARAVYNGTGSPVAANCVLASVRKLSFAPTPSGEVSRVEYSFVFGGSAASLAAAR